MRFEIRYPTGETHEVELQGTIAILGRDPSCDLVINDVKCSRRHAVMEAGPDGLAVRDSGSANGVYVNGRKIDRSPLREGDLVKLGDVTLAVLPEEVAGTLVMAPDEYGQIPVGPATFQMQVPDTEPDPEMTILPGPNAIPMPAPPLPHPVGATGTSGTIPLPFPPPPLPSRPAPPPLRVPSAGVPPPSFDNTPTAPATPTAGSGVTVPTSPVKLGGLSARPLTVTILAALWGLCIPLYLLSAVGSLFAGAGIARFAGAAFALLVVGISGVMGWGLWTVKPWARMAQIVLAGLGIVFTCPFAVACVAIIVYLLRPAAKARFAGTLETDPKETMFAAIIGVGVVLGGIGLIGVGIAAFFGAAAQSIPVN